MSANPLLTASTLPHQFPRFDLIKEEHYVPAFEQGMAEQLQEVAAIAGNAAPATFDNTIVALEAFVGLVSTAVATGLVFAKFARPSANVLFSNVATLQTRDGVPHLVIRAANKRNARIVDAQFKMMLQHDTITA